MDTGRGHRGVNRAARIKQAIYLSLSSDSVSRWDALTISKRLVAIEHAGNYSSIARTDFNAKKSRKRTSSSLNVLGGDEGDRTPDLLTASQALSQLSYAPKWCGN